MLPFKLTQAMAENTRPRRLAKLGYVKCWPGSLQLSTLALGDPRRGHGGEEVLFFLKKGLS